MAITLIFVHNPSSCRALTPAGAPRMRPSAAGRAQGRGVRPGAREPIAALAQHAGTQPACARTRPLPGARRCMAVILAHMRQLPAFLACQARGHWSSATREVIATGRAALGVLDDLEARPRASLLGRASQGRPTSPRVLALLARERAARAAMWSLRQALVSQADMRTSYSQAFCCAALSRR